VQDSLDGTREKSKIKNLIIADGIIQKITEDEVHPEENWKVINASGKWVTPGFIDTHTHYDAEVLMSPGLKESVKHGVTTCVLGSCSISMVYSDPIDCSDIFTRVEGVPREIVLPLLEKTKTWKTPKDYIEHIKSLPLGPNINSFIGHSDIRIATLGLSNAVDKKYIPTDKELEEMVNKVKESLEAGFIGCSMMTTKWDKIDGERQRSKPLPSTFARLKEFRVLNKVLRKYDGILQGAPDIVTKYNMFFFLYESAGLFKKKLKTTLITLADTKSNPIIWLFAMTMGKLFNFLFQADFRWQAIPCRFQVFADGMDLVVFEEFGAGEEALHIKDQIERNKLLSNQSYRKRFLKDYKTTFSPRVWHRNFGDAYVLDCPNKDYINKSFADIAVLENKNVVDAFLDCVIEYGTKLRWTTTIANHRKKVLEKISKSSAAVISFSDAGAHLRNMAFYNFPIQFLKMAYDAQKRGEEFITLEHAVFRLTKELADWFNLNTGHLYEGAKADLVIIDPSKLNDDVLEIKEAEFKEMGGMKRLVNSSGDSVSSVFINGIEVFTNNSFIPGYGETIKTGEFLLSKHSSL
jgi:N-acyl-D-aspartate/D-glutamate deacylase